MIPGNAWKWVPTFLKRLPYWDPKKNNPSGEPLHVTENIVKCCLELLSGSNDSIKFPPHKSEKDWDFVVRGREFKRSSFAMAPGDRRGFEQHVLRLSVPRPYKSMRKPFS